MENKSKIIKSMLVFLALMLITFFFIFKDNNINQIMKVLATVNVKYVALGVLCMIFFMIAEGVNIGRVLKILGNKTSFFSNVKYAMTGFFFSSISPSGSLGQPMQLYVMSKDKIKLSNSTMALLIELTSFQVVTIFISIFGFILNFKTIIGLGIIKYLLLLGIIINIAILIFLVLALFSNEMLVKLATLVSKILKKMHFKNYAKMHASILKYISEYQECSKIIKVNKKALVQVFLTTFVQLVLYNSIPYFIYRSFGLSSSPFFLFTSLQALLYASTSSLPIPGAVGVTELSFLAVYKLLFPKNIISSAMLLSRGISFYLSVLVTGTIIALSSLFKKDVL